jgi:hypothetical protein
MAVGVMIVVVVLVSLVRHRDKQAVQVAL